MALFISSNIHQGDEIISVQFRGKQCALKAISLSVLSFGFIVLLYLNLLDRNIFLCQEKWLLQNNWDTLHHVCVMEWHQLE